MSHYEARKKAEEYIRMAEGYDGAEMIEKLRKFLPKGVKVLELGMGPGTDLLDLGTRFEVVGSDASQSFLDIFTEKHPEQGIRLMQLDAVTIETDERFDGIYSNKVLQYFDEVDLKASFVRQAEVLNAGVWCFILFGEEPKWKNLTGEVLLLYGRGCEEDGGRFV